MKLTYLAKLVTGELVIGAYYTNEKLLLEDVYLVHSQPTRTGFSIALYPYMMPFSKSGANIDSKFIIYQEEAPEELEAEYIKVTTGLII